MQVKRITSMIFLLFLFFTVPVAANLPARPASDISVQDNADLLSKDTKQQILSIGHELDQKTTAQIVVVTVKNLDDQSIEEYAHQLFRQWGIGSKDKNNGILLLISQNPRKLRIEVGYGLEGAIPDGYAGRIRDKDLTPNLKKNDYDTGVLTAYQELASKTAAEYGTSLNGVVTHPDTKGITDDQSFLNERFIPDLILLVLILAILLLMKLFSFLYHYFFHGGSGPGSGGFSRKTIYTIDKYSNNSSSSSGSSGSFGGGDSGGGGSSGNY